MGWLNATCVTLSYLPIHTSPTLLTFWWVSVVLALLARPIHRQVAKGTETCDEASLGDVPRDSPQEYPGAVGRVLVPFRWKLATPSANHLG